MDESVSTRPNVPWRLLARVHGAYLWLTSLATALVMIIPLTRVSQPWWGVSGGATTSVPYWTFLTWPVSMLAVAVWLPAGVEEALAAPSARRVLRILPWGAVAATTVSMAACFGASMGAEAALVGSRLVACWSLLAWCSGRVSGGRATWAAPVLALLPALWGTAPSGGMSWLNLVGQPPGSPAFWCVPLLLAIATLGVAGISRT